MVGVEAEELQVMVTAAARMEAVVTEPQDVAAWAQSALFGVLAEPSHRRIQGICNA